MKGFIIVLFSLMVTGLATTVIHHEQSHYRILQDTGFENITMGVELRNNLDLVAYTSGTATNQTDWRTARDLNLKTEIFGYHMLAFTINLWLMVVFAAIIWLKYGSAEGLQRAKARRKKVRK